MSKAVIICKEIQTIGPSKGAPDIGTGYSGWVFVGNLPGAYAIYVIAATGAQLTTIQANVNCVGGALITESGVKWGEMNSPISTALRTKINNYLTAQGMTTVPAGTTLLQIVRRAAAHFDGRGNFDIFDSN